MNKKRFRKTGLHWVKQGAGFSLLTILIVSTVLGAISGGLNTRAAQAADTPDLTIEQNQEIRVLRYFKDCLNTYLNTNSGSGFKGFDDIFTRDGQQEKIAVGIDLDPQNGVWTCPGVARRAISFITDADDEEAYLMKFLWGKTYAENGGPVKVSSLAVTVNAKRVIRNVDDAIARRENQGSPQRANLKRFSKLLDQCYQNWSDTPFKAEVADSKNVLEYRKRKVFAERREFDWDEAGLSIRSVAQGNGPGAGSNGYLGGIELNFFTKQGLFSAGKFDDRASDWYPIGNDLGSSVLGSGYYKNHSGQTILDCNWVKANNSYLFDQSHKWFFAVKDGKPWISTKNSDGKVEFVEEASTNTSASGTGSNNYQCIVEPPLSWIACPVITTVVAGIGVLEGAIVEAVQVPPLTTDGPFEGLHTTWAGFRDLANAFLVLIFLIAIFAQVLPLEIDPYMVKKVLPKLIAAAIFIQFSYFFVQVMFDISRVLAQGVTTLIESIPVGDIGGGLFGQDIGNTTATSTLGLLGTIAVGGAGIAAVSTAGLALAVPVMLLLAAGLLSVVTLFVTLQVRMIVIIIFTIISPLAFLAWILPNTENYFKKWLTGLIKLLLMYPIIVFMVQGVNLISNISYEALAAMAGTEKGVAGGVGLISQIMVSIIPIIVYFMIPMTFKWAGGIFGSVSGAIQGQGNRMGKRLRSGALMKNSMEGLKQKTGERLASTEKFGWGDLKSPGRYGSGMKRLGARVATGNAFSFGRTGARKLAQTANTARHAKLEAQVATVKDLNAGNDVIGEMISARLDGKDTYTYTDRAGEKRTIKLSDDMVAGGIKYLNDNGGQIELAKIGNGTMDYKDAQGVKVGRARAAFNVGANKFNNDLGNKGQFAMGEIFKETTEGNVAALMKAAPHLVHGKKAELYKEANGDVFAGIKGESMIVAAEAIKGDAAAEANFADAIVDIMNSSSKSGGMDKQTALKMKELIEDQNSTIGDQEINLGDGSAPIKLRDAVDKIFTAGNKLAYNDKVNRVI